MFVVSLAVYVDFHTKFNITKTGIYFISFYKQIKSFWIDFCHFKVIYIL